MTDTTAAVETRVVSEFDRVIAAARTEAPRARSALNRVRGLFATGAKAAVASVPGEDVGIIRYAKSSTWHTVVVIVLGLGGAHYAYRAGERHVRSEIAAQRAGEVEREKAATAAILADATKRADAAEASVKANAARIADYEKKLAAKPETVTVTKEVPVDVVRNVLVPVPHETVRTVVLAGKPAAGGGCALTAYDVRRLRAIAP